MAASRSSSSRTAELPPQIAVVGAGTMGAGIAQLGPEHGPRGHLIDVDPVATGRAWSRIGDGLGRRLVKQ
ncbi:MAG: 3-hydroxyacyl-CoA dehydrogenase NAD-binding domain-containing protein, partial [Candidatus Limnocylindrales bacterium]